MPELCTDVLQAISENEIEKFNDVFMQEWPFTGYAYGFFKTCDDWRKKDGSLDASMFYYGDDINSGIFVGIMNSGNRTFGLIVYALEGYEAELKRVLLKTKKINWNRLPLIQGVLPRHTQILEDVVEKKGLKLTTYVDTTLQYLHPEKALSYEIRYPHDVYVNRLTLNDVDTIYGLWALQDIHTKKDVINSIEFSPSFGIFSKEDNELLAWVMQAHYGAIGMLYTKENVRRHGYAKILVMIMAKQLAMEVMQPYAMVMESNTKSISLFHSVGFEQITRMKYLKVNQD